MAQVDKLDRQWAFDTALNGLRAQGKRSVSPENNSCAYRSPEGLRCGIGFLIPDERYSSRLEGMGAWNTQIGDAVLPGIGKDDRDFLGALQPRLHDELDYKLTGLEAAAADFAEEYGLTYTAPAERVAS